MMLRPFALLVLGATTVMLPELATPRATVAPGSNAERYCYSQWDDESMIQNGDYDGRFTFFRVRYEPGGRGWGRRRDLYWNHDTPRAEQHFMRILREITTLRPQMECGAIHAFGDPESFRYPIAYVSEPGFWTMSSQELEGLRQFVQKGGFVIFDDFFADAWYNFEALWKQAFPESEIVRLDLSHPIFDSFYRIESLDMIYQGQGAYRGARSEFYGVFEDNDPKKRLIAIINYQNDLGDYMEYSDTEFVPIDLSNEAYKLMVNYVIYAMTH